jgi:hypothetical protein
MQKCKNRKKEELGERLQGKEITKEHWEGSQAENEYSDKDVEGRKNKEDTVWKNWSKRGTKKEKRQNKDTNKWV